MDREAIVDLFAPLGPVTVRRMFGGAGIYASGTIIAIAIDGEIYLKTDDVTRGLFTEAGSHAFVYTGKSGPVTMSYWLLPPAAYDDPDIFRQWGELAVATARRAGGGRKGNAREGKPR